MLYRYKKIFYIDETRYAARRYRVPPSGSHKFSTQVLSRSCRLRRQSFVYNNPNIPEAKRR